MSKHTPGPWEAVIAYRRVCDVRKAGELEVVCENAWEPDARLIAAAPELLESLKAVTEFLATRLGTNAYEWPSVHAARAAIRKATGG